MTNDVVQVCAASEERGCDIDPQQSIKSDSCDIDPEERRSFAVKNNAHNVKENRDDSQHVCVNDDEDLNTTDRKMSSSVSDDHPDQSQECEGQSAEGDDQSNDARLSDAVVVVRPSARRSRLSSVLELPDAEKRWISNWHRTLFWPFVFFALGCIALVGPFCGIHFYAENNIEVAMWASVLVIFFGRGAGGVILSGGYLSAGLAWVIFSAMSISLVVSVPVYILLSYAAELGPFATFDPGTGASNYYVGDLIWLYFASELFCHWCMTVVFSNVLGLSFIKSAVLHSVITVPLATVSSGFMVGVNFAASYFTLRDDPILEFAVVGVAYPAIRVAIISFWVQIVRKAGVGDQNNSKAHKQREFMEFLSHLTYVFGCGNAIHLSLLTSWVSYLISHVGQLTCEIVADVIWVFRTSEGGFRKIVRQRTKGLGLENSEKSGSAVVVVPKQDRDSDSKQEESGVSDEFTTRQALIEFEACRCYAADEAQKIIALISPIIGGCLMEILLRIAGSEHVRFVGWPVLITRVFLNLLFETLTDYIKVAILARFFNMNMGIVKRDHYVWDYCALTWPGVFTFGTTLLGMLLVQMYNNPQYAGIYYSTGIGNIMSPISGNGTDAVGNNTSLFVGNETVAVGNLSLLS